MIDCEKSFDYLSQLMFELSKVPSVADMNKNEKVVRVNSP